MDVISSAGVLAASNLVSNNIPSGGVSYPLPGGGATTPSATPTQQYYYKPSQGVWVGTQPGHEQELARQGFVPVSQEKYETERFKPTVDTLGTVRIGGAIVQEPQLAEAIKGQISQGVTGAIDTGTQSIQVVQPPGTMPSQIQVARDQWGRPTSFTPYYSYTPTSNVNQVTPSQDVMGNQILNQAANTATQMITNNIKFGTPTSTSILNPIDYTSTMSPSQQNQIKQQQAYISSLVQSISPSIMGRVTTSIVPPKFDVTQEKTTSVFVVTPDKMVDSYGKTTYPDEGKTFDINAMERTIREGPEASLGIYTIRDGNELKVVRPNYLISTTGTWGTNVSDILGKTSQLMPPTERFLGEFTYGASPIVQGLAAFAPPTEYWKPTLIQRGKSATMAGLATLSMGLGVAGLTGGLATLTPAARYALSFPLYATSAGVLGLSLPGFIKKPSVSGFIPVGLGLAGTLAGIFPSMSYMGGPLAERGLGRMEEPLSEFDVPRGKFEYAVGSTLKTIGNMPNAIFQKLVPPTTQEVPVTATGFDVKEIREQLGDMGITIKKIEIDEGLFGSKILRITTPDGILTRTVVPSGLSIGEQGTLKNYDVIGFTGGERYIKGVGSLTLEGKIPIQEVLNAQANPEYFNVLMNKYPELAERLTATGKQYLGADRIITMGDLFDVFNNKMQELGVSPQANLASTYRFVEPIKEYSPEQITPMDKDVLKNIKIQKQMEDTINQIEAYKRWWREPMESYLAPSEMPQAPSGLRTLVETKAVPVQVGTEVIQQPVTGPPSIFGIYPQPTTEIFTKAYPPPKISYPGEKQRQGEGGTMFRVKAPGEPTPQQVSGRQSMFDFSKVFAGNYPLDQILKRNLDIGMNSLQKLIPGQEQIIRQEQQQQLIQLQAQEQGTPTPTPTQQQTGQEYPPVPIPVGTIIPPPIQTPSLPPIPTGGGMKEPVGVSKIGPNIYYNELALVHNILGGI